MKELSIVSSSGISTPNDSHGFYTRLCIEHGKPVLVEKPFAMNREEAASILALAEEKGIYAAEAMWTWHNPISQQSTIFLSKSSRVKRW